MPWNWTYEDQLCSRRQLVLMRSGSDRLNRKFHLHIPLRFKTQNQFDALTFNERVGEADQHQVMRARLSEHLIFGVH